MRGLATRLGVDEREVRAAREAAGGFHAMSIDLPDNPASDPADVTSAHGADAFTGIDESDWLGRALVELTERERLVLRLRFEQELTQSQIADQIGVSQMQVSRILRATLGRLRRRLEASLEPAA